MSELKGPVLTATEDELERLIWLAESLRSGVEAEGADELGAGGAAHHR